MAAVLGRLRSVRGLWPALLVPGLLAGRATPPASSSPPVSFEVREVSLGKAPPSFCEESLAASSDGLHVAYVAGEVAGGAHLSRGSWMLRAERKQKVRVIIDGVEGPPFDRVSVPFFSPDGQHAAYTAWKKETAHVVVDGSEVAPCSSAIYCLDVLGPVFSADGRHLGFGAARYKLMTTRPKWRMVVDGSEGESHDGMSDPVFSLADAQPTYTAHDGKKDFVIQGGRPTPAVQADGIAWPAVSPDGKRVAYLAQRHGSVVAVVDGRESPTYDWIGALVFSRLSILAYPARSHGRTFMVVEGKSEEPPSPLVDVGDPVFSPDGGRLAYWVYDGSSVRAVVDGAAGKPYEVGRIAFGPDGRHLMAEARDGARWMLVVDGIEGPEYSPTKPLGGPATSFVQEESGGWRGVDRNAWAFSAPDLLTHVFVRDGELFRTEVRVVAIDSETDTAAHGGVAGGRR